MEDARKAFREAVRGLSDSPAQVVPATVKAVNAGANTCTVVLEEGSAEYDDVRLTASADDATDRLLVVPAVGSRVLVGVVDGLFGDFFLVATDKVDEVQFRLGTLTLKANVQGVNLVRGNVTVNVASKIKLDVDGTNLKDLFTELKSAINAGIITTPGGTLPAPCTKSYVFTALDTKINALLE